MNNQTEQKETIYHLVINSVTGPFHDINRTIKKVIVIKGSDASRCDISLKISLQMEFVFCLAVTAPQ